MPIEMRCTGCGQALRVADEHAGKKARCPSCGTIAEVPLSGGVSPLAGASASPFSDRSPFPEHSYPSGKDNPFADRPESDVNPYAAPAATTIAPHPYARPHRGGLVLTFGIIGILCCVPLGIAAWVMGASDLAEIRAGRMDPSGEGITRVGMILGIVAVGFAILWVLLNFALIAVAATG
jgi:ribosomal protein S27E